MDRQLDGGTLLYVLGVGFALAALLYFVRDVVFALSITVRAALLFLAFLAFLVVGVAVARDVLDRISLVLSGAAYVVFLAYVVTSYGLAATGSFLLFALSAVLFVGLGYGFRTREPDLDTRLAAGVLLAILVVGVLLVGADVATAGQAERLDLEDTVTVSVSADAPRDREVVPAEATIGTLTVENRGPFTRPLSLPAVEGCVAGIAAGPGTGVFVDIRPRRYDSADTIGGGETRTYRVTARLPLPNGTDELQYRVERGSDCEDPRVRPTLIVNTSVPPTGD
jgi:hypothetical protein